MNVIGWAHLWGYCSEKHAVAKFSGNLPKNKNKIKESERKVGEVSRRCFGLGMPWNVLVDMFE
jgi:hypothetical protein